MATPPDFTAGQVLTAAQMNAVGLWLVKSQTIGSAVSSVTVNDAFNNDFDHYKITISGGTASTVGLFRLALGASNTGYYSARGLSSYAAGAYLGGNLSNGAYFEGLGVFSTLGFMANFDLLNPGLALRTFITSTYAAPITTDFAGAGGGFHNVATAYTSFTLTTSTGTISDGTIRVYGYRN
jgi:hypothetical protein